MSVKKPGETLGPEPERLKLEGNWELLIGAALRKERPVAGWPKPEPMPQRAPKAAKKK